MKHNPKLTPFARQLRKNMTKEECELWYKYLRKYPYQFRRQVTVGTYILDFYCAAAKVAVELDGSQHFTPEGKQHDEVRTGFLQSQGIQVLRYPNSAVMTNLRGVCSHIDRVVQMRISELS
jgi:very-short-patch-repair endonuclease